MKNNEEKMTRLIEHEGVWRKIGDLIQIKKKKFFVLVFTIFQNSDIPN